MQHPSLFISLGRAVFCACAVICADAAPVMAAPTVHQITASDQGLRVNCYVVEGEHGLVAIDSALTVSDAAAVRQRIDALGKPLLAILITHGHPDHYNGVAAVIAGRQVPVYATAAVGKVIRSDDDAKQSQWKPVFKDEWPDRRAFPDREIRNGDKLTFDGMVFVVHDLGAGESHADSYWELLGAERAAFVGDAVLAGSHAYANDGHTSEWIHNLDRLSRDLKGAKRIYPGHGAAGDASLFAWERAYLVKYRAAVDKLRAGRAVLTDAQKRMLVDQMKAAYPGATNEFMIGLSADTVAAELARRHP
jgi:glyoxylase-like metal-dependent hydrolase (beta-lactamase superfamily II)